MPSVRVLSEFCKGCRLCVSVCPRKVLEMSGKLNRLGVRTAWPLRDKECSGCLNCVVICPDAAIEIRSS